MRHVRLLPVAPRPCKDELLTSWQCRIVSRYSSTPPKILAWLGGRAVSMQDSFEARDFRPDQDMTWRWARACRLKERDLQRLALSNLDRPEDCYLRDPLQRGVCAVCLDEDAENGGDHYCRRSWAHVEAVACLKHGVGLQSACQRCFRGGLFQFQFLSEGARLVCPWCAAVISERGRRQPRQSRMLESMSAIGRAIDGKGVQLDQVMAACRFLWAAQPHGSPYISYLGISLPYGRLPPSPRAHAPLSTLPLAWRAVSIEAMAELTGLLEPCAVGTVPPFLHEAFRRFREGEGQQAPEEPAAAAQVESAELKLRSDGDYHRLALQILNSQAWKTTPANDRRKKNRAIGRLMNRALSGG
ncbi:hypothetical protein CO663_34690 [Rhizobium anhuiense]|uniref:TniQ family protein n=1 Tax=Rhizobium TaxID=379 RepID=UPI000408D978|nr:TniQ family protein [Rhizobium sp. BK077]PDS54532.1 hypothetical protein CO663_34690 [Rhizobium anhuiense]